MVLTKIYVLIGQQYYDIKYYDIKYKSSEFSEIFNRLCIYNDWSTYQGTHVQFKMNR